MLTDKQKEDLKAEIIAEIHKGITKMQSYHLRQIVEETAYNELGIGYAMGVWSTFGMGDDYDSESLIKRLAKTLNKEPTSVLNFISSIIEPRIAEQGPHFDSKAFRLALEAFKELLVEKIDSARSTHTAHHIRMATSHFIFRCLHAHPEDDAPDIQSERQELTWIGTDEERPEFSSDGNGEPVADLDVEIPF